MEDARNHDQHNVKCVRATFSSAMGASTSGETARLARFIQETAFEDLPDSIVDKSKKLILDIIGISLAGSRQELGPIVTDYVNSVTTEGDSTIWGQNESSPFGAALANGSFAHSLDFDDTYANGPVLHPSAPVFSAALAAAEPEQSTGKDVLEGYAIGLEVARRIGKAVNPKHYDHGFHNTGTIGSFGATAAVSSILDLSVEETRNAFGIVASSSSTMKAGNFGKMTKPYHAGHAASMGVQAATLARGGFKADKSILEGETGYGNVMAFGEYDPTPITEDLGADWIGFEIKRKLYPNGSYYQGALEAIRRIVERETLNADDVESVHVDFVIPMPTRKGKGELPQEALQGKFSVNFLMAAVLLDGDVTIGTFTDEYVTSDAVQEQMRKVTSFSPDTLEGDVEFMRSSGTVSVTTVDGREITEKEEHSPDTPPNPVDQERFDAKFFACADWAIDRAAAEDIKEIVDDIEECNDINELTAVVHG